MVGIVLQGWKIHGRVPGGVIARGAFFAGRSRALHAQSEGDALFRCGNAAHVCTAKSSRVISSVARHWGPEIDKNGVGKIKKMSGRKGN